MTFLCEVIFAGVSCEIEEDFRWMEHVNEKLNEYANE